MHSYIAYGLSISSDLPLPELTPGEAKGEVHIRLSETRSELEEASEDGYSFDYHAQETTLSLARIGYFRIRAGSEITVSPYSGVDYRLLRRYLIGNIMAFLLLQRGRFVLHASAVQVKASAIALAGASGSGKSSLAAALTRMGHGFIVDDVCALNMSASPVRIYPGFPQLKLSLEAAQVLDISPDELTPFEDQEVEQIYCLASNYHSPLDSLPLGGIYILNHQPENGLQHLEAREAVLELIRHSLPTRYHRPDDPSHFLQCVRLANEVPIYRLGRPASVTQLPELARQVEAHVLGEIRT